jgi:hypothetical protein
VTTKADEVVDRGADKLENMSERLGPQGGVKAKLADELAEDAAFLRKLKPSLMVARAKGDAPTNEKPGQPPRAPRGPQLGVRPTPRRSGGGPSPFLVVGAALLAGMLVAKLIDWRSHAHPRD